MLRSELVNTYGAWSRTVLVGVGLILATGVATNYYIDAYGIYRNAQGRNIAVYSNARTTKYLLARHYVPENFDGLLFGSSITENWNLSALRYGRVYNASISGGNATEELLIAENAFRYQQAKVAIVAIFYYETESHGRKSMAMSPDEYWGGLGSISLISVYVGLTANHFGHVPPRNDWTGTSLAVPTFAAPARQVKELDGVVKSVHIDPDGFADFCTLVRLAHARADRVVALIPPIAWPVWEEMRASLQEYDRAAAAVFEPEDTIVDFNAAEYASFRQSSDNYPDGHHLSAAGAAYLVEELDRTLDDTAKRTSVREYLSRGPR